MNYKLKDKNGRVTEVSTYFDVNVNGVKITSELKKYQGSHVILFFNELGVSGAYSPSEGWFNESKCNIPEPIKNKLERAYNKIEAILTKKVDEAIETANSKGYQLYKK